MICNLTSPNNDVPDKFEPFMKSIYLTHWRHHGLALTDSITVTVPSWLFPWHFSIRHKSRIKKNEFHGLLQNCGISIANAMAIPQLCTKRSIYGTCDYFLDICQSDIMPGFKKSAANTTSPLPTMGSIAWLLLSNQIRGTAIGILGYGESTHIGAYTNRSLPDWC